MGDKGYPYRLRFSFNACLVDDLRAVLVSSPSSYTSELSIAELLFGLELSRSVYRQQTRYQSLFFYAHLVSVVSGCILVVRNPLTIAAVLAAMIPADT